MDKILSIIIPTFNMEKYLRKCLNSLLIKDNKLFMQLDVIVINDGSSDNSSEIAHEYEQKYPEVFRTIDKENGNYGSCINRGLKEARGKYVKILDSDDSFDTKNLEGLIKKMNKFDVDLFISDYIIVDNSDVTKEIINFKINSNVVLNISEILPQLSYIEMHAVAYKLNNLKKIRYSQTEGISYTDQEWMFIPFKNISTVCYNSSVVYKYLVGRSGQTIDLNVYHKKISDRVIITKKLITDYNNNNSNNGNDIHSIYLHNRLMNCIKGIYISYLLVNRDLKRAIEFDEYVMKMSDELYNQTSNLKINRLIAYRFIRSFRIRKELPPRIISFLYKKSKKIND